MVTTKLSPFMKRGSTLDVTVSSIGDAKSLEGGTLLMSPLQATDGEIYALAQGALSIGGINKDGPQGKSSYSKNHTLVGEIPNGAIIQKEAPGGILGTDNLSISLSNPDFTSAVAMAKAINANFKKPVAEAKDPVTVSVAVPEDYKARRMEFISEVENLDFLVSTVAKVVLNEKTGTVIAGGNVSISEVAVSQGSITIQVKENQQAQVSNTNAANSAEPPRCPTALRIDGYQRRRAQGGNEGAALQLQRGGPGQVPQLPGRFAARHHRHLPGHQARRRPERGAGGDVAWLVEFHPGMDGVPE